MKQIPNNFNFTAAMESYHDQSPALSIESLIKELRVHPVNSNKFFIAFKNRFLTSHQLQVFVKQYHYFCFQFVKVLEGLLYRTPIEALEMRIELVKTLYSELGSGLLDRAHIRQLERFAHSVGLKSSDLAEVEPMPAVTAYLGTLRRLFLESSYMTALGAEMAVETIAASEFQYFLPGLKKYGQFNSKDLEFFELHILEEQHHSDWLIEAVRKTAQYPEDLKQVAAGAREVADAWLIFWSGVYQAVFDTHPSYSIH